MATTMFVIAGIFWIVGSGFHFAAGSSSMGALYLAVGLMDIVVGIAQAS